MNHLPDAEREVFDLLWYEGLTQVEAANVLGVTERTIKNRWRNAKLETSAVVGRRAWGMIGGCRDSSREIGNYWPAGTTCVSRGEKSPLSS